MAAGALDLLQIGYEYVALFVQVLGFLVEHFRITDDGIQGRAQLVGHVGKEGAFGFVGLFGHLLRPAQFHLGVLAVGDVAHGAGHAVNLAVLVPQAQSPVQSPAIFVAGALDAKFLAAERRVTAQMGPHAVAEDGQIVGVNPRLPLFGGDVGPVGFEAEKFKEPARNIDFVGPQVPIPQGLVGGIHGQHVALFAFVQFLALFPAVDGQHQVGGKGLDELGVFFGKARLARGAEGDGAENTVERGQRQRQN